MIRQARIYYHIFRFYGAKFARYRYETVALLLRKILTIGLILVFWYVVGEKTGGENRGRELLSYFLIATSVFDLTATPGFRIARDTSRKVKLGAFDRDLLKPVNSVHLILAEHAGSYKVDIWFSVIGITLGILLNPSGVNLFILPMFLCVVLLGMVGVGLASNLLIGALCFHTVENASVRLSLYQIARILGGFMVPLSFATGSLKTFLVHNPFAVFGHLPSSIIVDNTIDLSELCAAVFWAVVLYGISKYAWRISLRHYDAAGL